MKDKKIITVMGATGAQGGGLVRAIHADHNGPFTARAVTRNASSDRAKALADLGAEVVEANADDPASLKSAFDGAYGAFCVTFFWEHFSPKQENQQAINMATAAAETGLEHVIWSTLEDTREWIADDQMPTLQEEYKVPHFDAKGEVDHVFEGLDVPTTYLLAVYYWDNMIDFGLGKPQRGEDGTLAITFPLGTAKMPGIAAGDIGKCAYGIFQDPDTYIGKRVGIAGEHLSGQEMADTLTDFFGEKVAYNEVTPEAFRNFGFPGAEDLGNMFQFYRDFEDEFRALRPVESTRELNPDLLTFREWLDENRARISLDD